MRCLGEIQNRRQAEAFVAYLLTQGISTHVDGVAGDSDLWEIWVRDEDRLDDASQMLQQFKADPQHAQYQDAIREAARIMSEKAKQRNAVAKNLRKVTYQVGTFTDRRIPPLTLTLVIISCLVSVINNFGRPRQSNELGRSISMQLSFASPVDLHLTNGDPAASLKKGEVWRAVTPIFLHGNTLHLVFNVIGLVVFGRLTERWMGTPRFALFVLVAALASNLLQGLAPEWLHGNPNFGGISGVVYALFGYIWVRTSMNPNLGVMIPFTVVVLLILPLVVGLTGLIPNWQYADLAHLGGLVVGATTAFLQEMQ